MLAKLIIINVGIWLGIMIINVLFYLFKIDTIQTFLNWLAVPASFSRLITRPWTIVTYMFLHFDFWHILFNMLWLYWFGKIFLEYLNERQLVSTYVFGGLAGALFYMLSFNLFPVFRETYLLSSALGASASVMAVIVAISYYVPNYKINLIFLGPVKIIYIAIVFVVIDILMIRSSNSGGHLAHIGGAIWGFYFIYLLRKGKDYSNIFGRYSFNSIAKPFMRPKKNKFKNVYTNTRKMSDEDYNYEKKQNQEVIDKILDKISKSGYDSLSKSEKEILFKNSNKKKP